MKNKGTVFGCMLLIAAILATGIWFFEFHSYEREATDKEVAAYSEYRMAWIRNTQAISASAESMILSFSTQTQDQGDVICYETEGLEEYLYRCDMTPEVYFLEDVLYVEYDSTDGYHVTLHFREDRSVWLYVFDWERDLLYTETEADATVITNYYRSLRRKVP